MAEKEKKHLSSGIARDSLAIILVVILILGYVAYECYSVTHIELETQTAVTTTVYETIDATALIVRDEQVIANVGAVTVPTLNDGDKINVGGTVAMSFDSSNDATKYSQYLEIKEKLDYYQNLEAQTVGQASSVESINKEINDDVNQYIQTISNRNVAGIESYGDEINDILLRRQMIIGQNVDLVTIIQDLRNQLDSYSSSSNLVKQVVKTDTSGIFSSYTDGYENLVDYSKAKEMTVEEIENAIEQTKTVQDTSSNLGKLITSYNWYFECVVDSEKVKAFENGQNVIVAFKDNTNKTFKVKIIDGAEPDLGVEKTALILECDDMNGDLSSIRVEDIEIRIADYTGIKVPTAALHVVDGKKGVYALISSQIRFRQADVIYSDDNYVLLSYDPNNKDGIRLYDKIILQGKDLEDGKVYT